MECASRICDMDLEKMKCKKEKNRNIGNGRTKNGRMMRKYVRICYVMKTRRYVDGKKKKNGRNNATRFCVGVSRGNKRKRRKVTKSRRLKFVRLRVNK